MSRETILILGAGPTGLGAAYRLTQMGRMEWLIVEAEDHAGGLAASCVDPKGFTWDVGGHVQFSHYDEYDRMVAEVLGDERVWHTRRSLVILGGRAVPYPFQYNLHRLNPEEQQRALSGLEEAASSRARPSGGRPAHFLDWIHQTFGSGLADLFMVPYNRKVWGYPLEMLDSGWVRERIAVPDIHQMREAIHQSHDNVDWGPNKTFWYPLRGGTGETWRRLAGWLDKRRVQFGTTVVGIDLKSHEALSADGRVLRWDFLITTIPLDVFCGLCHGLDDRVQSASRSLVYSACHLVGVGCRGGKPDLLNGASWLYFPDAHSPYYRVTVLSNYSPFNAPAGCWSLLVEVSETRYQPVRTVDLCADVLSALHQDGLISDETEIITVWQHFASHGYPTPFLGRDDVLHQILPRLETNGVYSRGRFGAWKYEVSNQDHSFMQGVELVNRLFGNGHETIISGTV